jgi:hypothetical protein
MVALTSAATHQAVISPQGLQNMTCLSATRLLVSFAVYVMLQRSWLWNDQATTSFSACTRLSRAQSLLHKQLHTVTLI